MPHKEKPANYQRVMSMDWWRRRESNPRPQILSLRLYMLRITY